MFSLLFAAFATFSTFPPMETLYHPVSTTNEAAQRHFNEGLLAVYAFNHDAAYALFKQASLDDPTLAMAYWGMALSLGENINTPITVEKEKEAFQLMQKASSLAKAATANEQAYITALSQRYAEKDINFEKLRLAYKEAMKQVVAAFPDDLDAATLYAESLMDLNPWKLWTWNGEAREHTLEIVSLLESVMDRNPMHLGANHYYIHAVESSKHPEKALMSAHRLENLLPTWGHIVHMPSHIYILVGDYQKAAEANKKAIQADQAYVKAHGLAGNYPLHYLSHNYFFLCRALMWQENKKEATRSAEELYAFLSPHWERMPELEYYLVAPLQVALYFHDWEKLVTLPPYPKEWEVATAFWHFGRSLSFLSLGKKKEAEEERKAFLAQKAHLKENAAFGYNKAEAVLSIATHLLEAYFSEPLKAIEALKQAVFLQDHLNYNEPPDWYYPIRQTLGAYLIASKQFQEGESVFREALNQLPRNGRSLFGLLQALKLQQKESYWIEREMRDALKNKDISLNLENL